MPGMILVHALCALLMITGKIRGKLRCGPSMLVIAILVPVFGPLCMLSYEFSILYGKNENAPINVNQMKIEDEIYRSIHVKPDDAAGGVVPVEESLLLNAPAMRRKLLLRVLSLDVSEYVPSLRLAGKNDDTEVVHYAVTALVELRKDFEDKIGTLKKKLGQSEKQAEVIRDFIALEEKYIGSGLPENGELRESLLQYDSLLSEVLEQARTREEKWTIYMKRAESAMALKDYRRAGSLADQAIMLNPDHEEAYLMKIKCCSALKDRKKMDAVLKTIMEQRVFLSEEGRQTIAFWLPDGVDI